MLQDFSPHALTCSHTAGLGWPIARGAVEGQRAAHEDMWRTGLSVAAHSRAEMPGYLYVSRYSPAFLSTTGVGAWQQKLIQPLLCCLLLPSLFPSTANVHMLGSG